MTDASPDPLPRLVPDYQNTIVPAKWVALQRFSSEIEAQLVANELESQSVPHRVFNAAINALKPYGQLVPVELQVLEEDLEPAKQIAAGVVAPADDLEPADPDTGEPIDLLDASGQHTRWVAVGKYRTAQELKDRAIDLQSAGIEVHLPRLVPRLVPQVNVRPTNPSQGDRPCILRVQVGDRERAEHLLQTSDEESGDESDLRCPSCGTHRVQIVGQGFGGFLRHLIGVDSFTATTNCECLRCHHQGPASEFQNQA